MSTVDILVDRGYYRPNAWYGPTVKMPRGKMRSLGLPPVLGNLFSMENLEDTCASLRAQIAAAEAQLAGLKRDLANAEAAAKPAGSTGNPSESQTGTGSRWPLLQEEYKRYGRQMIVSQVGLQGLQGSFPREGKSLTIAIYRPAQIALCEGLTRRRWGVGMSCGTVSCWCWGGHTGFDRW